MTKCGHLLISVSIIVAFTVNPQVGLLSRSQIQRFNDDGYLVINDFVSPQDRASLIREAERIVVEADVRGASVFKTNEQERTSDNYFLSSGDDVKCFFEEKGVDLKDKLRAINKIGHALHEKNPTFNKFCMTRDMVDLARSLGYQEPAIVQTMYIFKQPRIGGEVGMHQDSAFLNDTPSTVKGFWFALQDATLKNGCLWAIPGSHKEGLHRRFVLSADKKGTVWRPTEPIQWDEKKLVPLPVPAGALILLHGDLVHCSFENTSDASRHAFTIHLMDSARAKWSPENWLQIKPGKEFMGLVATTQ